MLIPIGQVKELLAQGKTVRVRARNGFVPVSKFIEKGVLDTFEVKTLDGRSIKVSREHKFFTNAGWVETKDLVPHVHSIFTEDSAYSPVESIAQIGKHRIVDITVDDEEHAYFGNGFLNHNSGKSLVCAHIMKAAQDEGGIAVLMDSENAYNEQFYHAIGLDTKKLIYIQPTSIEDVFDIIDRIIEKYAKGNTDQQNKKIVIVVDSVTATPTKKEMEAGTSDQSGYGTEKAKFLSQAMRRSVLRIGEYKIFLVFTNQLRQKLNAQAYADPWTTSGGKAIDYYTSVRIRLSLAGDIKNADKDVIGLHVRAKVVKNRCGPPKRTADLDIYFDRGIDDFASWVKFLKDSGIISGTNGRFTYTADDGTEHKFQTSTWKQFTRENPDIVKELYNKMADYVIMRYKSDDVSVEEGTAEIEEVAEE